MVYLLSCVWLFVSPWTVTCHAPLSMGFSMARTVEWVAISFSRGSSWARDQTQVSYIAGRFFTNWAIREAHLCFVLFFMPGVFDGVIRKVTLFGSHSYRMKENSYAKSNLVKKHKPMNSHLVEVGIVRWQKRRPRGDKIPIGILLILLPFKFSRK